MTSPIDPPRRSGPVRRVRRSDDAARGESTDRSVPVVYEPPPPPAPSAAGARPEAAFAAQMLGQDGQKRGLRAGAPHIDSANASYNRAEWSGSKDRRAPRGRHAKTEI